MPPIERQLPDPFKQMKQKQTVNAQLLAAQNIQKEGLRKEQDGIRADEAEEKQTNANRLKPPPPLNGHKCKKQAP